METGRKQQGLPEKTLGKREHCLPEWREERDEGLAALLDAETGCNNACRNLVWEDWLLEWSAGGDATVPPLLARGTRWSTASPTGGWQRCNSASRTGQRDETQHCQPDWGWHGIQQWLRNKRRVRDAELLARMKAAKRCTRAGRRARLDGKQ